MTDQNQGAGGAGSTSRSHRFLPPEGFSFKPQDWKTWKERFEQYRFLSKLTSEPDEFQVKALIYTMGGKAIEILDSSGLTEDNKKKYKNVIDALDKHFVGKKNTIYERAVFGSRNQQDGESMEEFITALYTLSESCEYKDLKEELVRDRLILGVRDKQLSEKLMLIEDLTLTKATEIARQWEEVKRQQQDLSGTRSDKVSLDRMKTARTKQTNKGNFKSKQGGHFDNRDHCSRCGWKGKHDKECPAVGQTCSKCKRKGHYAKMCFSKSGVNEVEEEPQTSGVMDSIRTEQEKRRDRWMATLQVRDQLVNFKLDPGADVTAIPYIVFLKKWKGLKLQKSNTLLSAANCGRLELVGTFQAEIKYKNRSIKEQIFVCKRLERALLGIRACEDLGLVRRVDLIQGKMEDPVKAFPKLFEGLGKFDRPYKIKLKEGAEPFAISVPRRVPLPLMGKIKQKLESFEKQGIIKKVDEPSEWCAPITIAPKANGDIRICVDLTELNRNVQRELHVMPSVEHSLGQLGGAKYFSKMDANSGFYQVALAEESCKLTTFMTPYGRFCFQRLPMGISSAPEHFQKRMSELLEGLDGVIVQMDDVLVWGTTLEEHDFRLAAVLKQIRDSGLTLNPDKCEFRKQRIKFLGHEIGQDGVRPDPDRVEAILKMDSPKNVSEVRRFMGMVNYMGRFLPSLSNASKPINELLKDETIFSWGVPQDQAFQNIKKMLVSESVLALYDSKLDTTISADASSYGLGAVLLQRHGQDWRPVSFISRSLSPAEQRYAQIEKEALALTWACERLRDFILGKSIVLETDHKPLLQVLQKKELDELSPRLQRFRMRLMRYSYEVKYVPGKQLTVADTLSRQPLRKFGSEIGEQEIEAQVHLIVENIPVTDDRLEKIWKAQQEDLICTKIKEYIQTGWPDKEKLDPELNAYFTVREELSENNGLLLKGCRLIIPKSMREEILGKLHVGHQGIVKCRARARETVWWPGLSDEIAEVVRRCPICIQERVDHKEPLIPSNFPTRPWQNIGLDLFKLDGKWYLVVMDYYSRYPEVVELRSMTAGAIVQHCKCIFARHGVPEEVRSDNGPQFLSLESHEFKKFGREYGFRRVTSSPRYPQSNGFIEAAVKTVKRLMKKSEDPLKALLEYRATPLANGYSPGELLMGRRLRSTLPMDPRKLIPRLVDRDQLQSKEEGRKDYQKRKFDQHHGVREKPELQEGDTVWIKDMRTWGRVEGKLDSPRSYKIATPKGEIRRNGFHLTKGPDRELEPEPRIEIPEAAMGRENEEPREIAPRLASPQGNRTRSGRLIKPPDRLKF